ncbi:1-deoxy-D-xylulose-5-phosphate synthase [Nocardia seriolae]|uniref:1-deoxy-D-xylulose-5-phosphate synthase n=1 Tax=Nocardia seriolae TaxID=37332 RepID=A0ABC9Z0J3_9NOCA|nr:hypothetical protein NSERKGN1266_35370 [Nocardia seriolae]GAM48759.1 1-deoxy-D-xylulose-5-phosphate synthase [Nocardia seriolae]GAP30758.1 1-deoxy-D-xylulose-5-phosphate synthase [Nocardia seriolae]GEM26413.1 hypothetical protein NS2_46520 [Nocardia seriolae NBRC 15557]
MHPRGLLLHDQAIAIVGLPRPAVLLGDCEGVDAGPRRRPQRLAVHQVPVVPVLEVRNHGAGQEFPHGVAIALVILGAEAAFHLRAFR